MVNEIHYRPSTCFKTCITTFVFKILFSLPHTAAGATWVWVGGIARPTFRVPGTTNRNYQWGTSKNLISNGYPGWHNRAVPASVTVSCLMLYSSSDYGLSDENCYGANTWLVCEQ